MEMLAICIDLGRTVFHRVGLNPRGEGVVREKFRASKDFASQRTFTIRLHGSLWRGSFSW